MSYFRYDASSLPGNVGSPTGDGRKVTDGRAGHLTFGPYLAAEAGSYVAGYYLRRMGAPSAEGALAIDVTVGGEELAHRVFAQDALFENLPKFEHVSFELALPVESLEVRLHVTEGVSVEAQSLVIFRTPSRIAATSA